MAEKNPERGDDIIRRSVKRETMASMARDYGISPSRVNQIRTKRMRQLCQFQSRVKAALTGTLPGDRCNWAVEISDMQDAQSKPRRTIAYLDGMVALRNNPLEVDFILSRFF